MDKEMNTFIDMSKHISEQECLPGYNMPDIYNDTMLYNKEYIQQMRKRIDILNKRLDDTKKFCDTLWEQLKEYERG